MADEGWIEMAVFIHGITPGRDPETNVNPSVLYKSLFDNIQNELELQKKPQLDKVPLKVIWNWDPEDGSFVYTDQMLAKAQRLIGDKIEKSEQKAHASNRFHFFLWKILYRIGRDIILYGLGDAMYYVSDDGERTVREHVFRYLCDQILSRLKIGGWEIDQNFSDCFGA